MKASQDNGPINILIGGEAGQGLVTVGELLARSLVRRGYHIVATQSYMSRIRGGHNTFAIRAGPMPITAPEESVDLLLALNQETANRYIATLTPAGLVVADAALTVDKQPSLKVPFHDLAPTQYNNVAALGVVGALLKIDEPCLLSSIETMFGQKKPERLEENRKALGNAYRWVRSQAPSFPGLAPSIAPPRPRLMLNGNEAIALGALKAGVKFCAFYPMTPSTSLSLTLIRHADAMGILVEQAEDEIAVINMAIGASFAGAPSLAATSGGGFALMVEGVSLAGMTETPLVIVVAQRPGPATGLPTRTEQADLEFVLHAGHGEFPRAILTPGSVEECFDLTQRAFRLAACYQTPIFILTDQFLADSYRAVTAFDLTDSAEAPAEAMPDPIYPYRRFALTESGVSPRLLPGMSKHLVVADSDEHTEDGHITENLTVRQQMVEKRLRKLKGLNSAVIPPVFQGDQRPDLLLVSWGSSQGTVQETAERLRAMGQRVGALHFPQVWPLKPDDFLGYLESARQVIAVEGNATAQLTRLIRRETGFAIPRRILRYDGLPLTPEYVLARLADERGS